MIKNLEPYIKFFIAFWIMVALSAFAFNQIKQAFSLAETEKVRREHINSVTEIERERWEVEQDE